MTGWKIGQFIDEMTGASTAVENLARSFIGLEPAMTKAEGQQLTINKAIDMGAAAGIKYADAIKFIEEQTKKNADAGINWRDKLAAAHAEVRHLTDAQKESIAIAQEAGATTEQLTNKYGISAGALEILAQKQKDAAAATAEHRREQEALSKAYDKLMSDTKNANQLAIMEADAAKLKIETDQKKWESTIKVRDAILKSAEASNAAAKFEQAYVAEQANVEQSNEALIASFGAMTTAHVEAGEAAQDGTAQTVAGYQAVAQQVEITSDGVKGWLELMRATNAANALLNQNSLFTTSSTLENQARLGGAFSPIPGFARGVQNFSGGLARVHEGELVTNLPRGASVIPAGAGGLNISNVFNLVDTESNLARRVSEQIMQTVRAGTQLGTA